MSIIRPVPSGILNGLPPGKPYAYRGHLPLEEELPDVCAAGCGRRMNRAAPNQPETCAVCRGAYDDPGRAR